jgi:hypothetical protein
MVLEVRASRPAPPDRSRRHPILTDFSPFVGFLFLQSTMICIDNSEWMRNGDYSPSRFQAQADAVNLICGAKTQVRAVSRPLGSDPIG